MMKFLCEAISILERAYKGCLSGEFDKTREALRYYYRHDDYGGILDASKELEDMGNNCGDEHYKLLVSDSLMEARKYLMTEL